MQVRVLPWPWSHWTRTAFSSLYQAFFPGFQSPGLTGRCPLAAAALLAVQPLSLLWFICGTPHFGFLMGVKVCHHEKHKSASLLPSSLPSSGRGIGPQLSRSDGMPQTLNKELVQRSRECGEFFLGWAGPWGSSSQFAAGQRLRTGLSALTGGSSAVPTGLALWSDCGHASSLASLILVYVPNQVLQVFSKLPEIFEYNFFFCLHLPE